MKKKRIVSLSLIVALIAIIAGGTYAYFTDRTETVDNTFAMGKVEFEKDLNGGLDEAKVDEYGQLVDGAERVLENKYTLVPGKEYVKDPTLHIKAGSEPAWVYVEVKNGLSEVETEETISAQMVRLGWENVGEDVWRHNDIVNAKDSEEPVDVVVFENFTIDPAADEESLKNVEDNHITVRGFAIQSDDIKVETADTEATSYFNEPVTP